MLITVLQTVRQDLEAHCSVHFSDALQLQTPNDNNDVTAKDGTSVLNQRSEQAVPRTRPFLSPSNQVRENKILQLTAITGFISHALLPVPIPSLDLSV